MITPIPRWSALMSMKDPLLDAQHIELLELCRSIQSDLERGCLESWAFLQRLNEFAFLLREHDYAESHVLRLRGQSLSHDQNMQRASALRDVEELASNAHQKKLDPTVTQHKVCCWIKYHF